MGEGNAIKTAVERSQAGVALSGRGRSCGNLNDHLQPAAAFAGRGEDPPPMQLHDAAAYRKAKAASLVSRARVVETNEALEDSSTLLGAEAGPLVIDGDPPDVFE